MVDFMKKYFISKVFILERYCVWAFFCNEYPEIMTHLSDSYNFNSATDLVSKLERGEISESPFLFLNTRYPHIYQNIIHYACLKLFKMGVFDSLLEKKDQEFVSTEMPDWNDLYVISGMKEEDEGTLLSSRERLIRTMLKDASWSMYVSNIIIDYNLIADSDALYCDIMDQAILSNEKVKKVLQVAKDEIMEGGLTELLEYEEVEELYMLVFLTDRRYPLELLHRIFKNFVAGQMEFYYENAVIIFHKATIEYDNLSMDCDWTSYNLFSALYAYYVSLFNLNHGIAMMEVI